MNSPDGDPRADGRRLRAQQRRLRARALTSGLLLAAALVPLGIPALGTVFYLRGPGLVVLGMALVWLWWHRHLGVHLRAVRRDLAALEHLQIEGIATLLHTRAPGLFAPARAQLMVGTRRFELWDWPPEQWALGQRVRARYAAHSGVLLALQVSTPASVAVEPDPVPAAQPLQPILTPTERHLLQLLEQGLDDKRIARALDLAPSTVRTYNATLFRKLGVRRRADAVQRARELGTTMSIDTD